MHREGKHGIKSNKTIRRYGPNKFTDRPYFMEGYELHNVKLKFGTMHYCERCCGRISCVSMAYEKNQYARSYYRPRKDKFEINFE